MKLDFYFFVMYWTLALSTVNVNRIKAIIGFWEWCVCLNSISYVLIFIEVLIDGTFVSSIVAGGTILAGFLTRQQPTFKILTYCFICSLIVVIVDFYNLSGCLVEPRKMCLTPSQ